MSFWFVFGIVAGLPVFTLAQAPLNSRPLNPYQGPNPDYSCPAIGEQNVAVVLLDYEAPKGASAFAPEPSAVREVFSGRDFGISVDSFIQTVSQGSAKLGKVDVFGPYRIPRPMLCSESNPVWKDALNAADADVDFTKYSRVIAIVPKPRADASKGCFDVTGLAHVSCSLFKTDDGYLNLSVAWVTGSFEPAGISYREGKEHRVYTVSHELLHGFGLGHSSTKNSEGRLVAYGDKNSVMGDDLGWPSIAHLQSLGWLQRHQLRELEDKAQGAYTLRPLTSEPGSGLYGLKIAREAGSSLWIQFRKKGPGPYDRAADQGVEIYRDHPIELIGNKVELLKAGSVGFAMKLGEEWTDPVSKVRVRFLDVDALGNAVIEVL